jgi:transposase
MTLKPGLAVQAMVLDALAGRTPLYRVEDAYRRRDVEILLGEDVHATSLSDTNLGRALDAVFLAGTTKIITEVGLRAAREFSLDPTFVHYDTTSSSVWGDYRACETRKPPPGPRAALGHSKDKRPDLKQFMIDLLCVERGVPILGRTLDGNASDKVSNNTLLKRIGELMARHGLGPGAFVYVADSALVTEDNLDEMGSTLFVTRLPFNYSECGRVVDEAVDAGQWSAIGPLAEHVKGRARPPAIYKAAEAEVALYNKKYRAVVVHSSAHDKRRKKRLAKMLRASRKGIAKKLAKAPATYFCEADAEAGAASLRKLGGRLHVVETRVMAVETPSRGRPSKTKPRRMSRRYSVSWEIKEDKQAMRRARLAAGCFVLLSNVPVAAGREGGMAMSAKELLKLYKDQYGVENNFAFLKDPLIVNDLFLKKPSRIEALGMILVIALMISRLMERSLRAHVELTRTPLPGWCGRETLRPTSFMMSVMLSGLKTVCDGSQRMLSQPITPTQYAYLSALGVPVSAFTDPRCECVPLIPLKNACQG